MRISGIKKTIINKDGRVIALLKNYKMVSYARYLYTKSIGRIPEGFDVHHINGDCRDDRIDNLEVLSH